MAQLDFMAKARPASGRWGRMGRLIAMAVLAVLTAGAAYEVGVALGWLSVGPEPGQAPVGNGLVLSAALLALIAGAGLCVVYASPSRQRPRADALGLLIAPAAAAFVAARFYTFDPYYAPTLRRMSADGLVAGSWVYTLVGLALLAAILTRVRPLNGADPDRPGATDERGHRARRGRRTLKCAELRREEGKRAARHDDEDDLSEVPDLAHGEKSRGRPEPPSLDRLLVVG